MSKPIKHKLSNNVFIGTYFNPSCARNEVHC